MSEDNLVRKENPSRARRGLRLVLGVLDPRAWLHMFKILHYFNSTHVRPMRKVTFGRVRNVSPDAVFTNPERIIIGERVRIGSRCHLWAGPSNGKIVLGDDVLFGPEVMLTAASYRYDLGHPVTDQPMAEADIVIGNDVWIATRALILPGANIGDGSIVAAGSVVKGTFPPMSIIAGSPAKVVSQRVLVDS